MTLGAYSVHGPVLVIPIATVTTYFLPFKNFTILILRIYHEPRITPNALHVSCNLVLITHIRDLQDHLHIQRFPRRTHRTQHIVLLMTKIYYSGVLRIHNEIVRQKDTHGVCKNPRTSFLMIS